MWRFTIRDLMWLVLVIGFGIHHYIDRSERAAREEMYRHEAKYHAYGEDLANQLLKLSKIEVERQMSLNRALQVELQITREAMQSTSTVGEPVSLPSTSP